MIDARDEAWGQYRVLPLNSDRFTQDQLEQDAFIAGWDAAKADLPDQEAVIAAIYATPTPRGVTSPSEWPFPVSVSELADAVLALFRGEEPK